VDKKYFSVLDKLYLRQKIVMWFSERQQMFCPLLPICPI